jgi:L-2-hydroxyglutarate oxidase LhgO
MDWFFHEATAAGVTVQTRCEVTGIEKRPGNFLVMMCDNGAAATLSTEIVINAAGLEADRIAAMPGIDVAAAGYALHWAKGSYFALHGPKRSLLSRLVYPLPPRESLGVHVVIDLVGAVRFGPDVEYLPERTQDYAVDERKLHTFGEAVRRIVPAVEDSDLTPAMSGIRPKLQAEGESPKDFVIREESARNLKGLVNLIGIDSPGLTASPAIAAHVLGILNGL